MIWLKPGSSFSSSSITTAWWILYLRISGETVEKVPKQILGWDAEKNDLTEYATINDFIIMMGHETPENHPLTIQKGFSTVSEELIDWEKNSPLQREFEEYPYKSCAETY